MERSAAALDDHLRRDTALVEAVVLGRGTGAVLPVRARVVLHRVDRPVVINNVNVYKTCCCAPTANPTTTTHGEHETTTGGGSLLDLSCRFDSPRQLAQ